MQHIKEVLSDIMKKITPNEKLDINKVYDIEIDDIDTTDSPDFCDAFISKGLYEGRELTEEECIQLQDDNPEWFYEKVYAEAYSE
jgi:hypothetical protein